MPCTHEPARPAQTLHLHIGRDNIPTFKTTRLNLNARLIKNILVTVNNELKSSLKKISANILCVCFGRNYLEKRRPNRMRSMIKQNVNQIAGKWNGSRSNVQQILIRQRTMAARTSSPGFCQYLPPRRDCHWREQTTQEVCYRQTSLCYIIQQHWYTNCVCSLYATFSCEGLSEGEGNVREWTYARVGGRHATNGRGRHRRLPNTKFEVFGGISGQTPVAKVMVFLWLLYATI